MAERIFRTLKEVKDTFFPNIPLEELEGELSEEEIKENIRRIVEAPKRKEREQPQIDSKKLPR